MTDDDDIRSALARAHEPAPAFAVVHARQPRRARALAAIAIACMCAVAVAIVVLVHAPAEQQPPPIALDLHSPALSSTTLRTPLDSLLDVPGLAVLDTTPSLVEGGLP
jgi:hypothetical protein